MPDIILHKPFYCAYSDVGLFGNFMFGNEIWNRQMVQITQYKLSQYAQNVKKELNIDKRFWNLQSKK